MFNSKKLLDGRVVRGSFGETSANTRPHESVGVIFLVLALFTIVLTGCSLDQSSNTPASTSRTIPSNAVQDYSAANVLQSTGRCDRAIPLYLKAIQKSNIYVNAYVSLGGCYQTVGSPSAAIVEYNKAIPFDPTNWFLYYQRAGAESSLGMNGQAQGDYNQAMRLAPPERDTYVSIANGFSSFSDFDDAFKAMTKAIDLSPNDPSLYEARGTMYLTAKQYTDAYNDYKKAIAVAPYKVYQASINANLAGVYYGQGDYDQVFTYMRKAISLQPGNAHLYVVSGNYHRDASRYTDAIGLYNQALDRVKHGPDAAAAHEGLGDALVARGQINEGIAQYGQAIRLTKDKNVQAGVKAKIKAAQQGSQS